MKAILSYLLVLLVSMHAYSQKREYYQLTIYQFQSTNQEQSLDNYLKNAWIPALHKKGIKHVGVFKPIANDTAREKKIYVVVPFTTIGDLKSIPDQIQRDKQFTEAGKDYISAAYNNPPYQRMEVWMLHAFELAPKLQLPALTSSRAGRVYEFRSYESPTEALYRNKVKMFNAGGEIALFKRLQFNAIFYAEVLAGSRMPNLVYMTSFDNMDERNKHWKAFVDDPEWKKLSSMAEYQNNMNKLDIVLMRPADYSDY